MNRIRIKHKIEYYSISSFLKMSRLLPRSILYIMSKTIISLSYSINGARRKKRVLEHLKIAFNTKKDLDSLYRAYIDHISSFYVEILLMITNRLNFNKAVVNTNEALSKLKSLLNRGDRGIILIVTHYGNWEFLGHWLAINGLNGAVVAKQMKNPLIDKNIIIPFRTKFGNISIERKGALISISKVLKSGGGVALLIDQMIPPPNGIEIEFFNKKVYATKSIATLKLKYDPLVVPVFAQRVGREKFKIIINEPIEYKGEDFTGKEDKIRAMTQIYTNSLQKQIKKCPAQWQWSYKRWRLPKQEANSKLYTN